LHERLVDRNLDVGGGRVAELEEERIGAVLVEDGGDSARAGTGRRLDDR
jgi:hypothetical protein